MKNKQRITAILIMLAAGLATGLTGGAAVGESKAEGMLVNDEGWLSGTGARLSALDKITARISEIDVPLNSPVRFGTLEIILHHCAFKPPEAPPEHAAFLVIRDLGYADANANRGTNTGTDTDVPPVFSGWMFASSPAVSGLEHAVYDLSVTACMSE